MRILTEVVGSFFLLAIFFVGITELFKGAKRDNVSNEPAAPVDQPGPGPTDPH